MEPHIKKEIKSIKNIHLGLIIGVLVFILSSSFLIYSQGSLAGDDKEMYNVMLLFGNISAIAAIIGGTIIFKNKMSEIESKDISDKIFIYRSASVIRAALIEGVSFFFITSYMLEGSSVFLYEAVTCLFILVYFFPTNERISKEIKQNIRELK